MPARLFSGREASADSEPVFIRSRTSVTSPSVAGSIPLTVMKACCSPAVTSALPSTIGEAPVTRGTCFSRRMSPWTSVSPSPTCHT